MLFRKLIRTAGRYRAQFISMIIMTALGIGMFLGFNMEWVSLETNMQQFFSDTGFADYRILSEDGFSEEDLEKIQAIEGVEKAARYLSVNADLAGTSKSLAITITEDAEVSGFVVMEGEAYDETSTDGIWLFDKFAEKNGITVGEELELTYETLSVKGTVKGLIESSEYMICLQDETQMMPAFDAYGYVYVSPAMLKKILPVKIKGIMDRLFHQINVRSGLEKKAFQEAVDQALGKTMVVIGKEDTVSWSEAMGEAQEGKTMGAILPVLFLLISVLTMVTTMHRIATNEKTQIGTLKALGFKNKRILRHYCSYSLLIGITGALLGIGLGYFVAWFILNPNGMMATYIVMPRWTLYIPWWCWLTVALVVLLMLVIGRISIAEMMKGTAADALRPYVPRVSRPMLIEKTKLWERLKFGTKWNLRDIMRHKSRSIVTLIGILGCMILMVAAIGMYETANAFIETTYVQNAGYSSRIFPASSGRETADAGKANQTALELAEEYQGDYSVSMSVQVEEETYLMDIYHIENDLIRFMDQNNRGMELPDDGAFVCLRIREELGLKEGDEITVSLFGTDAKYRIRIAGFNRSMTESISLSDTYASTLLYEGEPLTESDGYRIGAVYTAVSKSQVNQDERISSVQSRDDIVDAMDSFMDILNLAVVILVIAAVVLGIVVLYNLGVMSYTERYREMATLKVVGFKNRQIRTLLISQNLWITVTGIIVGIFAGIGVLVYLMKALAPEYEMKVVIGPLTIIISVAVTFAVSLLVGLMVSRKSRKIDMVEALKTPE